MTHAGPAAGSPRSSGWPPPTPCLPGGSCAQTASSPGRCSPWTTPPADHCGCMQTAGTPRDARPQGVPGPSGARAERQPASHRAPGHHLTRSVRSASSPARQCQRHVHLQTRKPRPPSARTEPGSGPREANWRPGAQSLGCLSAGGASGFGRDTVPGLAWHSGSLPMASACPAPRPAPRPLSPSSLLHPE